MAIDLSEEQYIESLKREVIPLGTTVFADVEDDAWLGYLSDAFWEAKLDGFLTGYVADEDGVIEPDASGVELDRKYIALVILYAGIRVLRNRILNTSTGFRAKAGPVEFEQQQSSATMLVEMLKQLKASKDRVLAELDDDFAASDTMVLDALSVRTFDYRSYWGSIELTGS